ncbi:glycosyltransferase [Aeromicrobium wangtongii]|uniref:Glycosyltransferase n=1 Tax=Aeromicrobium wangtongii TaxID=2969247 RepID=A0ABY5M8S9_9ACTN|nr:glycosyltransferase [Aeromicrobium wangtongii]MCD9200093.1 glycosyltransferase [Aeromicrobium wangtongii]UUP13349.1 glycosyltransferase [Aeromicrobium wangtongii]
MRAMPAGAYVSVIGGIRPGAGGQTRVLLLRHRLFAEHRGIDVPILTFNPRSDYDRVRRSLHDDGLLLAHSRVLNMHEDLRGRDISALPAVAPQPRPPATAHPDRTDRDALPWRSTVTPLDGGRPWFEYARADGTIYSRTPVDAGEGIVEVLRPDGLAVDSWPTLGGMWRWWTRLATPPTGHVFILSDSRFVSRELAGIDDDRFFVLHQMHNPHTIGRRHWTSAISPTYADAMEHLGRLDVLSSLTARQRDDVARRYGATDNLVVIPNPVELPPVPEPRPARRPGRIVVIARLHSQKRLDLAVDAFAQLVRTHPWARLDLYGSGPEREALERQVADLGVGGSVTLHGHDPRAADELWSADVAWLTSAFEGYSLFLLEARARECPVVSFDVPYGPREQITDGVDGLLVRAGDTSALAAATGALLDDRARLEEMRAPARAGAAAHGPERFLDDWAEAVAGAVTRKRCRTRIDAVTLRDVRLRLPGRDGRMRLSARLSVDGVVPPDDTTLVWQAYTDVSPDPVDLPATVTHEAGTWTIVGDAPVAGLPVSGRRATVRLLLVSRNSAWRHELFVGDLAATGLLRRAARRVAGLLGRDRRHGTLEP